MYVILATHSRSGTSATNSRCTRSGAGRASRSRTTVAGTLQIVALYPVFVFLAAVIGFGRRLRVPADGLLAIVVLTAAWATLYAGPDFFEFTTVVRSAVRP